MTRSESIKELATALAKAQAKIAPAPKDATNPHFEKAYATLAAIVDACRMPLSDNGLSVFQGTLEKNGKLYLETVLMHVSGEWRSFEIPLILEKQSMQGLGSAITYARRYGYGAAVGVVSDEDDDGNEAEKNKPRGARNDNSNRSRPPNPGRPAPQPGPNQQQAARPPNPQPQAQAAKPNASTPGSQPVGSKGYQELKQTMQGTAWDMKAVEAYLTKRGFTTRIKELTTDQMFEVLTAVTGFKPEEVLK